MCASHIYAHQFLTKEDFDSVQEESLAAPDSPPTFGQQHSFLVKNRFQRMMEDFESRQMKEVFHLIRMKFMAINFHVRQLGPTSPSKLQRTSM
jgi:hypothetical protein